MPLCTIAMLALAGVRPRSTWVHFSVPTFGGNYTRREHFISLSDRSRESGKSGEISGSLESVLQKKKKKINLWSPWLVVDKVLFQDSASFVVAAVSTQSAPSCIPIEMITQLGAHVNVLDFPEVRSRLLDILTTHRQVLALPGEPFGVTDHVTHHIGLKPGTRPVYVPSYRLPHSQCKVAHDLVDGKLAEGIIQELYSPWNSLLFLVPKKDGSCVVRM